MFSVCTQTLWSFSPFENVHGCPWPTSSGQLSDNTSTGTHKFKTAMSKRHFMATSDVDSSDGLNTPSPGSGIWIKSTSNQQNDYSSSTEDFFMDSESSPPPSFASNYNQKTLQCSASTSSGNVAGEMDTSVFTDYQPTRAFRGLHITPNTDACRSEPSTSYYSEAVTPDRNPPNAEGGMEAILRDSLSQPTGGFYRSDVKPTDLPKSAQLCRSRYHSGSSSADSGSTYQGSFDLSPTNSGVGASVIDGSDSVQQVSSTSNNNLPEQKIKRPKKENQCQETCQVCGDMAAGLHCGAFVCEACKKFYIRGSKQPNNGSYTCTDPLGKNACEITKKTRTSCSSCRYKKCIAVGMHLPGCGMLDKAKVSWMPCTVCGATSSGFHFGALTCEGCKSFFRRCLKDNKSETMVCKKGGNCEEEGQMRGRDVCRPCRFNKCISVGMSANSSRVGRQPNSLRYARIMQYQDRTKQEQLPMIKQELPDDVPMTQEEQSPPDYAQQPPPRPVEQVQYVRQDLSSIVIRPVPLNLTSRLPPPVQQQTCNTESSFQPLMPYDRISANDWAILEKQNQAYINFKHMLHNYYHALVEDSTVTPMIFGKEMMRCFLMNLEYLLIFIKTVHGFQSLTVNDRVKLTQRCILPVLLLAYSQRYDLENDKCTWFNMSYETGERWVATFPEYEMSWRNFKVLGKKIKLLDMTVTEQSLLSVIIFVSPEDVEDLTDSESVTKLHRVYMKLFSQHINETHGLNSERHKTMWQLMVELRKAATQHILAAKFFSQNHPNISIPDLYNEIFVNNGKK